MSGSYRPEFKVDGAWYPNGERWATRAGAEASAKARFYAWTMPSDWRVRASGDEPNRGVEL